MVEAISWTKDTLNIIDQTKLPAEYVRIDLQTVDDVYEAIKQLKVRGAPAIGITAAYGLYVAMRNELAETRDQFFSAMQKHIDHLSEARPTAVNLVWALHRLRDQLSTTDLGSAEELKKKLLELAVELHEDD
ncbi:MAG: S-methyl-5-thioribose-1-phosphate isomerase, partial [Calditrichota bacterium]